MKTQSGRHIIFDATTIPAGKLCYSFSVELIKGNRWFFQPAHWFPHSSFYGSIVHTRKQNLMLYSPGFPSAEEALKAAEAWEIEEENLQEYNKIEWATVRLS